MKKYVYAIGNCASISNEHAREWRQKLDECFMNMHKRECVKVIDITDFYSYEEEYQKSNNEIPDFCLRAIEKSEAVVINNQMLYLSQGSGREIGYAKALNKPIFIINEGSYDIYPWDERWAERTFEGTDAISDCAKHILKYVFYDI